MPVDFSSGIIINPFLEDWTGNINAVDQHCEITLISVISIIFEKVIFMHM